MILILVGPPGSGKSYYAKKYQEKNSEKKYIILSRDQEGGTLKDLSLKFQKLLEKNHKYIILDNLHPTIESRKLFIDIVKKYELKIKCVLFELSIENAQINILRRQYQKYNRLFHTSSEISEFNELKKSNKYEVGSEASYRDRTSVASEMDLFPIMVLYKFRKEYQKPTLEEGFSKIKFKNGYLTKFNPQEYKHKALFLDYDGTLRDSKNGKYPTKINEIIPKYDIRDKLIKKFPEEKYIYLGVSNQSPIAKSEFTEQEADQMFQETNQLLFQKNIDFQYCPHGAFPIQCYCRKPNSGMLIHFIEKYKLNPSLCYMIGDRTTDKTFANRLGINFIHVNQL